MNTLLSLVVFALKPGKEVTYQEHGLENPYQKLVFIQ